MNTRQYELIRTSETPRRYAIANPSGVEIAFGMTWRVARDIADLLNGRAS